MKQEQSLSPRDLTYTSGLDRLEEPVVSSHFMHRFCNDSSLDNYNSDEFQTRSQYISMQAVSDMLLPLLLSAARAFCREHLVEVKARAREHFGQYGLASPSEVGAAHFIAEIMLDPNYSKNSQRYYSRQLLSRQVAQRIEAGMPIRMVIPALPFKISSPLKSRGRLPDLAEVNFLLQLYEIALTVELLYREVRPTISSPLAQFAVVSDGSRFNALVGERDSVVMNYRLQLLRWIERLGIADYIRIYDYRALLSERLPPAMQRRKSQLAVSAAAEYGHIMWPIFDPLQAASSLRRAAGVEPDPERECPEGRFASLLKSLVYTINYKSLSRSGPAALSEHRQLYRELTAHIFEPYVSDEAKECLRQAMLKEVWEATILYLAEIKSDRELDDEPILTCLPDHIRWTIHAKRGQLAIAVPTALGLTVQAWAGAAVFKQAKRRSIKLCTLPVLALEGAGAIPVKVQDSADTLGLGDQPLFYIYPDVFCEEIPDFLARLPTALTRRRAA